VNGPVLITGAAGFAGSHLLELLAGSGDLVAWTRKAAPPALARLARWQQVDLLDRDGVRTAIHELKPAAVYHCAGMPHVAESFSDTASALAGNILGTHHLYDALRRAGVHCRIVQAGSALVYQRSDTPLTESSPVGPASPYAISKLGQEQLGVRAGPEDGLDVILTRPFNHTGPRQTPLFFAPSVARQLALIERGGLDPVLRVGNTDTVRDLSDVRDVARAYAALMRSGVPGTIYNIASGVGRTIREILDALLARAKTPVRVEVDPSRLRANDTQVLVGDTTRLRAATGWSPQVSFDQMIDDLLSYWRNSRFPDH
jgi:GDP-4-dehydro-6-deoxy-D-mannose reductase